MVWYLLHVQSEVARTRIIEVAARLLDEGGPGMVSTRTVSAAAGVHAPAIYRLFGGKDELLEAAANYVFLEYLKSKTEMVPSSDPVEDLSHAWDLHIEFGLAHPHAYTSIYGQIESTSETFKESEAVLVALVRSIAEAGLLSLPELEAFNLINTAGRGTVFTLIASPPDRRDTGLSRRAFEMVRAAIIVKPSANDVGRGRSQLATEKSALQRLQSVLSRAERTLLNEWLKRDRSP